MVSSKETYLQRVDNDKVEVDAALAFLSLDDSPDEVEVGTTLGVLSLSDDPNEVDVCAGASINCATCEGTTSHRLTCTSPLYIDREGAEVTEDYCLALFNRVPNCLQ